MQKAFSSIRRRMIILREGEKMSKKATICYMQHHIIPYNN